MPGQGLIPGCYISEDPNACFFVGRAPRLVETCVRSCDGLPCCASGHAFHRPARQLPAEASTLALGPGDPASDLGILSYARGSRRWMKFWRGFSSSISARRTQQQICLLLRLRLPLPLRSLAVRPEAGPPRLVRPGTARRRRQGEDVDEAARSQRLGEAAPRTLEPDPRHLHLGQHVGACLVLGRCTSLRRRLLAHLRLRRRLLVRPCQNRQLRASGDGCLARTLSLQGGQRLLLQ